MRVLDPEHSEFMLRTASSRRRGVEEPITSPWRHMRPKATGAVIVAPKLFIATVEHRDGKLQLIDEQSRIFELDGRETGPVRRLWRDLENFVATACVDEIMLRASPASGQYTARPDSYKIETLLQMLSGPELELTSTLTVGSWVRREDPDLPGPWDPLLKGQWRNAQLRAIETAAYAINVGQVTVH